jgi:hypothetical protein
MVLGGVIIMVEILKIALFAGLALLAGCAVAYQGVIRGDVSAKVGTFKVTILGHVLVADFVNFRKDLIFYRLAVLPTGQ